MPREAYDTTRYVEDDNLVQHKKKLYCVAVLGICIGTDVRFVTLRQVNVESLNMYFRYKHTNNVTKEIAMWTAVSDTLRRQELQGSRS